MPEIMKLLQESSRGNASWHGSGQGPQEHKQQNKNKLTGLHQTKRLLHSTGNHQQTQPTEWGNTFKRCTRQCLEYISSSNISKEQNNRYHQGNANRKHYVCEGLELKCSPKVSCVQRGALVAGGRSQGMTWKGVFLALALAHALSSFPALPSLSLSAAKG